MFQTTAFSGHKVTSVKQFQAEDYEALLKKKAFCAEKYHEKEVTRFYCRVCQTCICQICLSMEHKNHEIELLDKAVDEERVKILAGVESIKQKHQISSDIIRQLEETAANLEHGRTGRGGEGGFSPPKFWATQIFLGSERKFGQSYFLKTFPCFFN